MRSSLSRVATTILVGILVLACAPAPSPAPIKPPPPSERPAPPSLVTTPSARSINTAPGTWTAAASMAEFHDFHTATLLTDGRVLVVGGSPNPDAQAAAELFDLGTGRWTATRSMATTRESHTATLLPDGRVLVAGGYKGDWLATAELYDPGSRSWNASGSMATARGGHTATLLPDGKILVAGGVTGVDGFYATLSAAEVFDPRSGKWTPTASMATARAGHTATLLPDGRVLVVGGGADVASDAPMLASAELYDPSSGRWTATGTMAEARATHTATLLPDGRVLVAGGRYAAVAIDGLASAELYDPSSGTWTATGSMAETRQNGHTATLLRDGTVLVVGDDHTRSAELYDPSSGQWTAAASTLVAPNGTATLLLDGTVLVVSGNDVQLYDPRGWPAPVSATLPVRGSAREIGERVLMAPGLGGTLFASIPARGGSVLLTQLDSTGVSRPGWPVVLDSATSCAHLWPVEDGSVRILCAPDELNQELNNGVRAYAFDSAGRPLAGWPIDLDGWRWSGRVIGDTLTVYLLQSGGDVVVEGQPSDGGVIVTIAPDGTVRSGASVPIDCCVGDTTWAIGPDGVAYGVVHHYADTPAGTTSDILSMGFGGVSTGWPVSFDGLASVPTFGPDGRIALTVASIGRNTSRVLAFDWKAVAARSAELPIATGVVVFSDGSYECGQPRPRPPLIAQDGTTFVYSELEIAVYALNPSLAIIRGWPFEPATPLERPSYPGRNELSCSWLAIPAVGPDSSLYLPLQSRDPTVGGSIVAVGLDGRVRPGWPVELRRAGAEFWSVVVGSDGTVYALAIEPEPGDTSSASILAIAPDSTVLWTTTIVEPQSGRPPKASPSS